MNTSFSHIPDELGFYGEFGGSYLPELLYNNINELKNYYEQILQDTSFNQRYLELLKQFVGRPTPLYFAPSYSKKHGCSIFFKREDLCHTGAHKINNTIGQVLLAKKMGKTTIVAETGAGQHGVATATVCALMHLNCIVFMGEKDIERQAPNVARMKLLGAEVIPASSGSKTLKDATNEALRYWINHPDAYYLIGSVVGPHPYPSMVTHFQAVISAEIGKQLEEQTGYKNPTHIIACVGGGSNAAGAFYHFYEETAVNLIAVEAAGEGIHSGKSAATSILGSPGILHGSYSLVMQDKEGQIKEPHSISAGLDYPGIGPIHAHGIQSKRVKNMAITDQEALNAVIQCARLEGIIPALESAHALAALEKLEFHTSDVVVINLSGRGDKDMNTYMQNIPL